LRIKRERNRKISKYREKGKGEKGKIKRKEIDRGRELKKRKTVCGKEKERKTKRWREIFGERGKEKEKELKRKSEKETDRESVAKRK
jgi:hypothetical protein